MEKPRNPLTLLVIEDDPPVVQRVRAMVERWDIFGAIEFAASKSEANGHYGRADVVLLDLCLPDSQGVDTITAFVLPSRAPVVIMTGSDDDNLIRAAGQQGAVGYWIKDGNADDLRRDLLRAAELRRAQLDAVVTNPRIERLRELTETV